MNYNFEQWMLTNEYDKVRGHGDRLAYMKEMIDWEPFIPIVRAVFHDNNSTGG